MRVRFIIPLSASLSALACPPDAPPSAFIHRQTRPATARAPEENAVVIAWNEIAYQTANAHDQFLSFLGARSLAMAHIAMHDALNAIAPRFAQYAYKGTAPNAHPGAAVTQAAYKVLSTNYPKQLGVLDSARTYWLGTVPNGAAKERAIALGDQAAAAIIAERRGDRHDAGGDYRPGAKPGSYQYTPGFTFALAPDFRNATPFALRTPNQFRAPPPPALTGRAYSQAFDEVKRLGVKNSAARTRDQTNYAHWWAEFAEHSFNRIGRLTATQRQLDLWATARLFALINMDIFDIYLATWDSKYHYNTWRPITAIQAAAQDGNPTTQPDGSWEPEMVTLPFPEYPSGHSAVCAGGAQVVAHVYGTPKISFAMQSLTALPGAETRSFDDVATAAAECADSRVMNGYHFRFATTAGMTLGQRVAEYIIATQLRPLSR